MKNKDLQPRLLYPSRLSFIIEGEINCFPHKKKLKEFVTTRLILQQMLKDWLEEGEGGEGFGRGRDRRRRYIKKYNGDKYLSVTTLNVNGLNAPVKKKKQQIT